GLDLTGDTQQVLYVMPDFMGYYIRYGKISGRLKTVSQFLAKGKVDINFVVRRAIKRAHRRRGATTSAAVHPFENDQTGRMVFRARLAEYSRPDIFRTGKDYTDHFGGCIIRPGAGAYGSQLCRGAGVKELQQCPQVFAGKYA